MIPFNRAVLPQASIENSLAALTSGPLSGNGPYCQASEQILSSLHDGSPALLTTSGSHALELAAVLLELRPGDEVIVPAFGFVTTASAFSMFGARIVFVDVEESTLCISPKSVIEAIGPNTRAICFINYGGTAARLQELRKIADDHGIWLVEDNSHGLGASYRGRPLGLSGDLSILSFHETKNVTTGEGGALVINDPQLLPGAIEAREKGTNRQAFFEGLADKYTWVRQGSSWVLADSLAALLPPQLENLSEITETRVGICDFYGDQLNDWAIEQGCRFLENTDGCSPSGHLFAIRFPRETLRAKFIEHMRLHEVSVAFHYQNLAESIMGKKVGRISSSVSESKAAANDLVRLPVHLGLSEKDLMKVVEASRAFRF